MDTELIIAIYCSGVVTGIFIVEPLVNILWIFIEKLFSKWRNKE